MLHIRPDDFDAAIQALNDSLVLAVPTETVYGLAVKADNQPAIDKLIALKSRPHESEKIFALMLGDPADIHYYAHVPHEAADLANRYFPGPLTLVLPKNPNFRNPYFDHYDTIGIRIPDHPFMLELLLRAGPLIVTSANPRGEESAISGSEVAERMPEVDAVIDSEADNQLPSTVIDATGDELIVLRRGPITLE